MSRLRKELFTNYDDSSEVASSLAWGAPFVDALAVFMLVSTVYAVYLSFKCNPEEYNFFEFAAALCCP